jgi:hypothetical protein
MRKLFAAGAALALGLGGLVLTAGPASAAKPVIDAHGSLHCSISGKVKVTPGLLFNGTAGAATFSTKIKSSSCTGSSGITKFGGTFTAVLPTNDCLALAASAFPSSTLTATKYKSSTAKPNPSGTITFSTATFGVSDPLTMDVPGPGTSTVPSGSFSGQHPTIHFVYDQTTAVFATNCSPKSKPAVKGQGGLKKMSYSGASYIDIP